MTLKEVLEIIRQEGIVLEWLDMECFYGIYTHVEDTDIIVVNNNLTDLQEIKYTILHELGHYFTGTLYSQDSDNLYKNKCEYKAMKWVALQLMPAEEIERAIRHGITEVWELAEYFDVPQQFVVFRLNLPDIQKIKTGVR